MDDLPKLPEPGFDIPSERRWPTRVVSVGEQGVYNADQMRDYARKAVLLERERCARICDGIECSDHEYARYFNEATERCAAAIRNP